MIYIIQIFDSDPFFHIDHYSEAIQLNDLATVQRHSYAHQNMPDAVD